MALHLAAVLVWPAGPRPSSPEGDDRRRTPELRRGVQVVALRSPPSPPDRPRVSVEVPAPTRREPVLGPMEPVTVEAPSPRWASAGGDEASGAPGTGSGDGTGSGRDGLRPPVPRSLLPDWSPPEEVRGHRVTVRVEVDERGRPTGRVELVPPTPSESFNRKLRRRMTRLEFEPARREGRAVTAWAEITFTFGG